MPKRTRDEGAESDVNNRFMEQLREVYGEEGVRSFRQQNYNAEYHRYVMSDDPNLPPPTMPQFRSQNTSNDQRNRERGRRQIENTHRQEIENRDREENEERIANDYDPHDDPAMRIPDVPLVNNNNEQPENVIEYRFVGPPGSIEKKRKRAEEDEIAGINEPDYVCELCRVGNWADEEGGPEITEILGRIYRQERIDYQTVSDDVRYSTVAKSFNEEIFSVNELMAERKDKDIKEWNMAIVRNHFEVCEKNKVDRRMDRVLRDLEEQSTTFKENFLFRQQFINGVPQDNTWQPDEKNFKMWTKITNAIASVSKIRQSIDGLGTDGRKKVTSGNIQRGNNFAAASAGGDAAKRRRTKTSPFDHN